VFISVAQTESRKAAALGRVIPLVFKVDRIKKLVETNNLQILTEKSADNIAGQIGK